MERTPLVEDIQNYAQNIVDTVREPLLILDATLRVQSANRAFYQTFHVSPGETEGRLIYELGNGQWDIPDLRRLLEDIVPTSSVFNDFELEHTFPVIGRRAMLLNARKLQAGHHGELLVLAMEDVTARKRAEDALLEAGALQSAIFNSANFSSIATDEKGVIQIFNVGAERMLGYTAADVVNKITPADISDPQEVVARAKALSAELGTTITPGFEALVFKAARGIEDIYELTYIRKDGSRFPAVVSVTALRDPQGGIIGYLLIGTDNTARKQVEAERTLLDQRVAEANGRMSRDLRAAAKIQETFLPRGVPRVPGAAFAWAYRPCDELAGDGLNIVPLGDGRAGLYVLDVSGHGVASALLSVALSRLLSPPSDPSSILVRGGDVGDRLAITPPAEVAARLNRLFPFDPATEQFATLVYGVLNAAAGEFRYASAGHPGPVHLPEGGDPVILPSQGFPIGLADDPYEERSVRLGVGDRLYLYSDGVPEAMDPAGRQFGDARLLDAIGRRRSEPLHEGTDALLREIARWQGSGRPQDDISILAVEVSAAPGRGEPGIDSRGSPLAHPRPL
jgi:serine phosphatase RsbU (regulator of sigma subunit)/PAS domain-containing protein